MIITIQTIPERVSNVDTMLEQLPEGVIVNDDTNHSGCFQSFKKMLDIEVSDYRLHLQDDIIFAKGFKQYLKRIPEMMGAWDMDVFSLFAPNRKFIIEQYDLGLRVGEFPNYLWLQATVFSARFIDLMRAQMESTKLNKWDDEFVKETLRVNKIKAYVHLPSLVQHNIHIPSSVGNANSKLRMSPIYDPNFIINEKQV